MSERIDVLCKHGHDAQPSIDVGRIGEELHGLDFDADGNSCFVLAMMNEIGMIIKGDGIVIMIY